MIQLILHAEILADLSFSRIVEVVGLSFDPQKSGRCSTVSAIVEHTIPGIGI